MSAVIQPHDLQGEIQKIRNDRPDPPLHQHQEEFKAFKDLYQFRSSTSLLEAPASKRAGGICSDQKLTLAKMLTRVQTIKFLFRGFRII